MAPSPAPLPSPPPLRNGTSLTTGQAARYLSVCPNTIKRWIAAGAIAAYTTPGGHYRIPLEGFRRFLEERGLGGTSPEGSE